MKKTVLPIVLLGIFTANSATAYEYNKNDFRLKFDVEGSAGYLKSDIFKSAINKNNLFLGDWSGRIEFDYDIDTLNRVGLVYALDTNAAEEHAWIHELFALWQNKDYGRMELGFTSAIAHKLGIGIPDVGGLHVDEEPLFYKKIAQSGTVIAEPLLSTGHNHEALRLNLVTNKIGNTQYGIGFASLSDEYRFGVDGAIKVRHSSGKLKSAFSVGASFMDKLKDFHADMFSANINADWRAQLSAGLNLQYNSFVWGTSVRGIYDYNPTGVVSDGIAVGSGVSYDLLQYSVSLSYIMSDTGIWHNEAPNYIDNTIIGSFRYKYSENINLWMSIGATDKKPFITAALRAEF